MKHVVKAKYYIRYADDFVIIHRDKNYSENLMGQMASYLHLNLRLDLHPKKVFLTTLASGMDFLGWKHFPKHRVLRTSTKRRLFQNLKAKKESGNIESIKQSYLGMLKWGNGCRLINKLNTPQSPL